MSKVARETAKKAMEMVKKFATTSMAGDIEFKVLGRRVILPDYRKEVILRRKPILKKIEEIPFKIGTAAEDIGYIYDLRKSEVIEVELACYGQYWKNLSRKAKFLMAAVVEGKIRIDQLDEDQLIEFLRFPNFQLCLSLGYGDEAPNYIKRLFEGPEAEKKVEESKKEEPIEKPKAKKKVKEVSMEELEKACEKPVKALEEKKKKSILDEDSEDEFI